MKSSKLRVGVIGATGYAGAELVRLLASHPDAAVTAVTSVSYEGKTLSDIYPNLRGVCDLTLGKAEDIIGGCDVVFTALPHGLSEDIAALCAPCGTVLIDLGADFRMTDEKAYSDWYKRGYSHPELHPGAVYCIPELHRERLMSKPMIIGNPGCYPTSIALGIAPALRAGLISTEGLIIDSKSGVTGAGRGLTQGTHYPDTNEAFSAYKAAVHRHTPEIEQTMSELSGKDVKVTFVPHLLPVNRGIESTIYARMTGSADDIAAVYRSAYENERFVRLMPQGEFANIKNVRESNYCDISLHTDTRTGTLIICSCIDNMVKGAAGQAIQNMNIRFGFDEAAGLATHPAAF